MNITFIDRMPTRVAYLPYTGSYGEPLSQFWVQTVFPWLAQQGLLEQARFGVGYDNPHATPPGQCRYEACVELPAGFTPAEEMLTTTIPAGRYAVLHFQGTVGDIGEAWTRLFQAWLPNSGFQLDARPCFEHYPVGSSHDPQTGIFDCDICIPVIAH